MERICEYCNKLFYGRDKVNIARFCSTYCQKERWRAVNSVRDKTRKATLYQSRKEKLEARVCLLCQNEFQPKRKDAKFCSQGCGRDCWRLNNEEYIKQDQRHRYHNDVNRKISTCLRSRLNKALKGNVKSDSTMRLIGCTVDELKVYIESQFESWMGWGNHGSYSPYRKTWHLDHVIPMSAFDLKDSSQQQLACHFSNIRPLLADKNLKKGAKRE
jgi:hypothetical protein